MIEANAHLNADLEKLEDLLSKVSIYWAHLDYQSADSIQGVQNATENKTR